MRLHGNEGEFLTDQETNDAVQNHANTYSADPNYLRFIVFGKRFIRSILSVDGAKGLILTMGLLPNVDTGNDQVYPIPRAVDKHGNVLPYPDVLELEEEELEESPVLSTRGGGDSNPVKCPTSCG